MPAIKQIVPITPRAMRPFRVMLGRKNLITLLF